MTDPKGGIANIKKKVSILKYNADNNRKETPIVFQRSENIEIEVSDYNSKARSNDRAFLMMP